MRNILIPPSLFLARHQAHFVAVDWNEEENLIFSSFIQFSLPARLWVVENEFGDLIRAVVITAEISPEYLWESCSLHCRLFWLQHAWHQCSESQSLYWVATLPPAVSCIELPLPPPPPTTTELSQKYHCKSLSMLGSRLEIVKYKDSSL